MDHVLGLIIIIIKYGRLLSTVTKEIYSLCTTVLRYLKTVGKNLTLKEYHNDHEGTKTV